MSQAQTGTMLFTQTRDPRLARELLGAATNEETLDYVRQLIDKGVPVDVTNESGDTALMFCTRYNRVDLVTFLLGRGANPSHTNKTGISSLILAARAGFTEIVDLLLAKQVNINQRTKDNETALSAAVLGNNADVAISLLNARAETSFTNREGNTLLHEASKRGNLRIMSALLDRSQIDLNSGNKLGLTPLMLAVMEKKDDAVRLLLNKNCNTNSIDKEGRTALMYACQVDADVCAQLLLDKNAKTDITDLNGRTANQMLSGSNSRTGQVLSGPGGRWLFSIKSVLDSLHLPYQVRDVQTGTSMTEPHTTLIHRFNSSQCGPLTLEIITPRSGNRVVMRTGSIKVSEARIRPLAEFVARINHVMTEGVFEVDMQKAIVRFRTSILFSTGMNFQDNMMTTFKSSIEFHLKGLDLYFLAIELVSEGNSPQDVYDRYVGQ